MSKIIGVTVGTPMSVNKIKEKIKPVLITEQTLTEAQKAQARANIGAATVEDVIAALPAAEEGSF